MTPCLQEMQMVWRMGLYWGRIRRDVSTQCHERFHQLYCTLSSIKWKYPADSTWFNFPQKVWWLFTEIWWPLDSKQKVNRLPSNSAAHGEDEAPSKGPGDRELQQHALITALPWRDSVCRYLWQQTQDPWTEKKPEWSLMDRISASWSRSTSPVINHVAIMKFGKPL